MEAGWARSTWASLSDSWSEMSQRWREAPAGREEEREGGRGKSLLEKQPANNGLVRQLSGEKDMVRRGSPWSEGSSESSRNLRGGLEAFDLNGSESENEDDDYQCSSSKFYSEYRGHPLEDLQRVLVRLRKHPETRRHKSSRRRAIFLAGDSTIDNKYFIEQTEQPLNGYEKVLDNKSMTDVCFYTNQALVEHGLGDSWFAINAAVEHSTLRGKSRELGPHDAFVRDNIGQDDILVISIGGNDLSRSPTLRTFWNCLAIMYFASERSIDAGNSNALRYLIKMFRVETEKYIAALVSKCKPRKVVVCMLYYPHESTSARSWASTQLSVLGYNRKPKKAQRIFRKIFDSAFAQINVPGVDQVETLPLYEVLDSSPRSKDYKERVQPSEIGGSKMAQAFLKAAQLV